MNTRASRISIPVSPAPLEREESKQFKVICRVRPPEDPENAPGNSKITQILSSMKSHPQQSSIMKQRTSRKNSPSTKYTMKSNKIDSLRNQLMRFSMPLKLVSLKITQTNKNHQCLVTELLTLEKPIASQEIKRSQACFPSFWKECFKNGLKKK